MLLNFWLEVLLKIYGFVMQIELATQILGELYDFACPRLPKGKQHMEAKLPARRA